MYSNVCDIIIIPGDVHRGWCEVLPGWAGSRPGSLTSSRHYLQRPQTRKVSICPVIHNLHQAYHSTQTLPHWRFVRKYGFGFNKSAFGDHSEIIIMYQSLWNPVCGRWGVPSFPPSSYWYCFLQTDKIATKHNTNNDITYERCLFQYIIRCRGACKADRLWFEQGVNIWGEKDILILWHSRIYGSRSS